MFWSTVLLLQAQALVFAHARSTVNERSRSIAWTKCPKEITDASGVASDCGTLAVPLDYTDSNSDKKLNLTLVKVKAAVQPAKGSILINPGGPGNGGAQYLATAEAAFLLSMTGGEYDIVGFDYRGTGDTLPVKCYDPKNLYDQAELLKASSMTPALTNASSSALGTIWAVGGANAKRCFQKAYETLPLISTAFTARDFIQVVDALGEDGMLRYWGHSYGTELGATIAAMFPERIDRMVIDGVVNTHQYTEGWEYDPVPAGDVTLKRFLEACVDAGPDACVLAKHDATVENLTSRIHDLLNEVKVEPILMGNNITSELVGPTEVMSVLNNGLRIAQVYAPYIAAWFDAVFRRNLTAYHKARAVLFAGEEMMGLWGAFAAGLPTIAIRCADSTFRADELDDVRSRIDTLHGMSDLFGDTYGSTYITCARWKVKGKEQYTGNYKAKTKNPMLIIGSPYDLRTPLASAHNVSAGFEGSVVLQHNGLGHTVMYSPGQCAIQAIRDYFNNGTLPKKDTVCEQDFDVFSGRSLSESFLPQGLENGTAKQVEHEPAEFTGKASGVWSVSGWAVVVAVMGLLWV